jgi:diguanylate cyclase (GGDEF)-like protein
MPVTEHVDAADDIRHHDALMRRVRVAAAIFAVVQLGVYRPPTGITRGFDPLLATPLVCGALLLISGLSWLVGRRAGLRALRICGVAQVGADAGVALGMIALFSFDPTSNVWALMIVPVLEGAVRHRLWGAVGAWVGQALVYVAISWWALSAHPHLEARPSTVTFAIGLVGLVAVAVGWLAGHLHERTEQYRQAQSRLADMVYVDALTRLPNRARLLGALDRLDEEEHRGYAVAFLDLDRFKEINDGHGHEAGDELLCSVARRLEAAVRPTDLVARLAGDEFVVVLPGMTARSAVLATLARLTVAVEDLTVPTGEVVSVGMSIGAAVAEVRDRPTGREVLRQADAAMYVAKRQGGGAPVVVEAQDAWGVGDGVVGRSAPRSHGLAGLVEDEGR